MGSLGKNDASSRDKNLGIDGEIHCEVSSSWGTEGWAALSLTLSEALCVQSLSLTLNKPSTSPLPLP